MSNPRWTRKALSLPLWSLLWIFPIFAGFVSGGAPAFSQATNFAIGTTVQQPSVKRLGIDLGGEDYWDSGQMMRNLIFNNPGFEGNLWQTVIQCAAVTAASCTDADVYTEWTSNFWAGGTIEVVSGAGNGETATLSGNTTSAYAAGNTTNPSYGATLSFSALSTPIAAGDWIIARTTIPGNAQNGWWTTTSGGATISTDLTDIAPDSPGKQAIELSASGSGQSAAVASYWDSAGTRQFVQMNGTYTIVFKAKSLGGSTVLNVNAARLATSHGNETFINQNVTLTNQWQDYSYTFTANEDGTYDGTAQLTLSLSGGSAYIDDVALTEEAAADNPTAFRNAVVDTLRALKPGVIRYMTGTDFGTSTADIVAPPFARVPAGVNGTNGTPDATQVSMGLEEFLVLCQAVGAEPWYTMSGGASVQDMQNMVEFLGGSTSTPYGALRASLGQSAPWTTVFPKIHIELGNEMWNWSMVGEMMNDPRVYGARAGKLFTAAKASPSYSPNLDLIMGSWAVLPSYTQTEMGAGSNYDSVDAAPYLYYNLSDYSSNEAIFGPMFAEPEMFDSPSAPSSGNYMAQQAAVAAQGPTPVNLDVYEVNLSTVSGTAPQNVLTPAVAGVGAGITVADHMLMMMRDDGITTQNMFALSGIQNSFSNTGTGANETTPLWGVVEDMGGATNLKRPQYLAEQLVNDAILPTMLATTVTGANPTWNQPLSLNDNVQLPTAHYLQSFAFTDGTHYSVIVINLSRSGSLPVTFSGTHAPTGNVLVSQLTSTNPTDNNEGLASDAPVVSPTQTNIGNFNPVTPYSLPPFSITTFSWPGSTLPASTTMLAAGPTSGSLGQNVTLTATVTSASGTTTPTGNVTFMNGSTSLGTGTLDAGGVATLSTTSLPAGANSITASYGGDSNDASSTSSPVTVTMTGSAMATTTTLAASPTSVNTGQNVTFTATVTPASGTVAPAGTVTFLNGSATLGTGTLNASGVAVFSTTALAAGADSITASYGGSTSDSGSVSVAVTVNVKQTVVATTTTLAASAVQITPGQSVTFTAAVAPQSGTAAPSGTVTFLSGTTTLGTGTLNSSGTASFSTTTLPAGADSITASYGGSAGDSASVSSAVTVNVSQSAVSTTTSLTASTTQVNTGQSVTFTAKVAAQSGTVTPTGSVAFMNGPTILGTGTLNASGVASFSTTALPAGSDSITASYGGSTAFGSSVSNAITVTVTQTQTATATALIASATQINTGQSVTFTATVAAQTGSTTPGGTVTFLNGGTALGTGTLNAGGVASFSTTTLAAGSDSITASYSGSTAFTGSTSTPVAVTVMQSAIATTTSLAASASAINTGDSVTFTAKVAAQSGSTVPTGTVSFLNGSVIIGSGTLNSGIATLTTTTLPAGADSITASYGGNTSDSSSVSVAVTVNVKQTVVATTTTLAASAVQITPGQSVTFTAAVAPQSGTAAPSGTVTFLSGTTTLGTGTLNSSGTASFSTTTLPAGADSITASYGGSAGDSASVSSAVTVNVSQSAVSTTTSLTASTTQVNTGQSVTFTAKVAAQSGTVTPTGSVAFINGSTILGTGTLNASGVASFSTTALPAGSDSITASYGGSTAFGSSVSNAITVTVTQTQTATATALIASATQINTGQSVTFTATVAAQTGSTTPGGTVTFLNGGTALGTGTLNAGGVASFSTTTLAAGSDSITASYSGSTAFTGSTSTPVAVTVMQSAIATTTSLAASASAINTGDSVTFTAKVAAQSGSTVPTGTVSFLNGSVIIGSGTLNSGIATFTTTTLPAGADLITASYGGNSASGSSVSSPVTVTVTQSVVATSTALTSSATQINSGETVVFTAVVTPQSGSTIPTGTVTFLDGSTSLGTVAVGSTGATFFASGLGVGTHSITASYGGSASNSKSVSPAVTVTVAQTITATTTMLTGSTSQIGLGQGVTFTAVVTPQSGTAIPAGTVSFLDGSTILGTGTLNASGIAYFGSTTLGLGGHSISASYSGSSSNSSSISSPFVVTVTGSPGLPQSPTITALTASTTQATAGQNVTLTANVADQFGDAVQAGSVTFSIGGQALATSPLNNGVAVLNTSSLPAGADSIVAVFGGDLSDLGSTSAAVAIVVNAAVTAAPLAPAPAATTTALTPSASQVSVGQTLTLNATVAGSGTTPTGTVTFLDGQTTLGTAPLSGGAAGFNTSSLVLGTHSITAGYGGDSSNAPSTSAAVTVMVASAGTPSYTMTVSSSDVSVTPGQIADLTVTLTPQNGFNMPVNLTCSGLPEGTTCSFNPATVTPNGAPVSSTLGISVAPNKTTARNIAPRGSSRGRLALGLVMPWGIFSLLGLSRRKNRSPVAAWSIRVAIAAALITGSLWMSGCGYTTNASVFTMTLTSSGANVPTHISQITVSIAP